MKRLLLVLFCVLALPVLASHIVGGEFEIIHLTGNQYRINLIIYFDERNGDPGAKDEIATVRIFSKRDNTMMSTIDLVRVDEVPVAYTQPECSIGDLSTSRLTYTATVTLSPTRFNDEQGYYIAWERCCRNYSITNIFSQNPQSGGNYAGQTFYLEFPAVVKNGLPFVNSSPRLFPPLSDYACPGKPYYVDFAGVDDDGDSLVYSLVTPLNTRSGDALPPNGVPRPRPYPNVTYRPGFSQNRIMGGLPDLAISDDGFLRVTPSQQGLFVFAVKCEEFRDGEKIGEVRRDFQMLVLDACPAAEPPQIMGRKMTDAGFIYDGNMSISFTNDVNDNDRCIQVRVSDPDASKPDDNFQERISIRAVPIGFKGDMSKILPVTKKATLLNGSTQTFDICFDQCPPNESGIFQVGIVAYDDACSLPLSDTLKITVNVEPPDNAPPHFTTPGITEAVQQGNPRTYPIEAVDPDGDAMTMAIISDAAFGEIGMTLTVLEQIDGLYRAKMDWDNRCYVYDFTQKTNFEITYIVEDTDLCNFSHTDTITFKPSVILPGNADPVISTDLTADELQNGVTRKTFESLEFNVMGDDHADRDTITLRGYGEGFNFATYQMIFPQVEGKESVTSHFSWKLDCETIDPLEKKKLELTFIVVDDRNLCGFYKADTLKVQVNVEPPDNLKPRLTITNTNPDIDFENNEMTIVMGQQISLGLVGTDNDVNPTDLVSIDLASAEGDVNPEGYIFASASGQGTAQTTFSWLPECSIFLGDDYENNYTFKFFTRDNRCFTGAADTVTVKVVIKDVDPGETDFIPPNFISPNGDQFNDFFAMVRQDEETGELESILPIDNCEGRFLSITIYNRWGRELFSSINRDFTWQPVNEATGVYFYTLKYSNRDYKGTITLRD